MPLIKSRIALITSDFPTFPAVSGEPRASSPCTATVSPAGPEPGVATVVGHLHPAIRIKTASRASHKIKAFRQRSELVVLPAFSPFAPEAFLRREMPPIESLPAANAWFL